MLHLAELTPAQRAPLQAALAQLGPNGLDWQSAVKQELQIAPRTDKQSADALTRIIPAYIAAVNDPSTLPELQQMIAGAPQPVVDELPNPRRVIEQKQDLINHLNETRALLR